MFNIWKCRKGIMYRILIYYSPFAKHLWYICAVNWLQMFLHLNIFLIWTLSFFVVSTFKNKIFTDFFLIIQM